MNGMFGDSCVQTWNLHMKVFITYGEKGFIILDRVNLTRNSHIIGSQLNVVVVGLVLSMSGVKAVLVSSLVRFSCGLTCVLTSELSDEMLCCSDHIRRVSLQCESSDEPETCYR